MTQPEQEIATRGRSGFAVILAATAVAGIASYFVTWLVPHEIGLARYAEFAVAWSAIYLVVGALSGVQQEITRASSRRTSESTPGGRARTFGAVAALVVAVLVIGSAALWVGTAFPTDGWSLVWPLAVGTASYVVVAVLAGTLYGLSEWRLIALMIGIDALLRLAAILIVLLVTSDVVALVWAVAAPFPLAVIVLWPFLRRRVAGQTVLDVGYRALTWNSVRTVVAAASTGVMVSGFPLLLGVTSHGVPKAVVGLYILTITLTRAPLIVVTTALQGYFLVSFRDSGAHFWRTFLRIEGIIVAAGVVLAVAGLFLGPPVFGFLFPGQLRPDGWLFAVLVFSSALVGALSVSAPAVLARARHAIYTAGWLVGALATIVFLVLPLDFALRTVLALTCAPVLGLIVHVGYLVSHRGGTPEPAP